MAGEAITTVYKEVYKQTFNVYEYTHYTTMYYLQILIRLVTKPKDSLLKAKTLFMLSVTGYEHETIGL